MQTSWPVALNCRFILPQQAWAKWSSTTLTSVNICQCLQSTAYSSLQVWGLKTGCWSMVSPPPSFSKSSSVPGIVLTGREDNVSWEWAHQWHRGRSWVYQTDFSTTSVGKTLERPSLPRGHWRGCFDLVVGVPWAASQCFNVTVFWKSEVVLEAMIVFTLESEIAQHNHLSRAGTHIL